MSASANMTLFNIAIIHGPNLNLLGTREPDRYGSACLDDLSKSLDRWALQLTKNITATTTIANTANIINVRLTHFQSNSEGALVDYIQSLRKTHQGVVINAAAYTHTSIAIRDALLAVNLPFVEVHLTNVYSREPFRHHSMLSDIAIGVLCGFGVNSYRLGLQGLFEYLLGSSNPPKHTNSLRR